MRIVFDTYAWIEYFEGTKKGEIVRRHLEEDDILTPAIVLLELGYKSDEFGWDLRKHLNFIKTNSEVIGINEKFVLMFGKIYNNVKKKIRDIGFADVVVLNTAILNNAKILTGDSHFKKIDRAIIL